MRYVVAMLLGLVITNQASALTAGIFLETVTGECQGNDTAKGGLPEVPEYVSLDMTFSAPAGNCQMIADLLVTGSEQPSLDLQISSTAEGNYFARGTGLGEIVYEFQVTGPDNTFVNINVLAAAAVSGSRSGSTGTGSWGVGQVGGLPGNRGIDICSYWGTRPAACLSGVEGGAEAIVDYDILVRTNEIFSIILLGRGSASALGGAATITNAEIQVLVDPTFSFVNPEDAALYTLEYSPNLTAVPLPATAPLLATGLLAAGAWTRRRRAAGRCS